MEKTAKMDAIVYLLPIAHLNPVVVLKDGLEKDAMKVRNQMLIFINFALDYVRQLYLLLYVQKDVFT